MGYNSFKLIHVTQLESTSWISVKIKNTCNCDGRVGEMKLVQGVLRSLAVGISPSCHGFSIARTLATSSASGS
ncbi:hypothetical protein L6452_37795 [Arctium lappa]|uniref:Uncharacterized protein n=1 Tax=Arctium lappa TaxID=4217 RepID=A0ACB8Y4G6_ARCLA|nr:hypothetical protein L6452_37795 [Arctium lappa]